MPNLAQIIRMLTAVALLWVNLSVCNFARAAGNADYASVGWWDIKFTETDNFNGCYAVARFQGQTTIKLTLLQDESDKQWVVQIYNPQWNVQNKKQHILHFVAVTRWQGTFSVTNDGWLYQLVLPAFMNSLADAHSLTIMSENNYVLARLNMKGSDAAIRAIVNCVREHPPKSPSSTEVQNSPETEGSFYGTAFFVAPNLLVTNDHVVKKCGNDIQVRYPEQASHSAIISARDETNDLALLRTDMSSLAVVTFRFGPRLGEPVASYGFPYAGLLSSSGNFTLGNVTSLSGINDDSRFLQISTPVQPGNSGGPLLDMSGNVTGVVEGQLNAIAMMQVGGSVPQNINFAIQAPIVVNFLSAKGVTPKLDSSGVGVRRDLPASDVADIAKKFTVQIYCQTGAAKTSERAAPVPKSPVTAIEQQAKEFVLFVQARWSKPNAEALAGLDAEYEDEVMYYGKMTKKDAVIKEKQAFVRRFPSREYKPKEPISVWCRDRACTVWGLVDFRAVDPVAQILSTGEASFVYELQMSGATVKISLEMGNVISRTRTSLSDITRAH